MGLEEWQIALRRQFGVKQDFRLENLAGEPGLSEFRVRNPASGGDYRVTIRGQALGMNRCTCGDFLTNELGTCKHIEFVLARLLKKPAARRQLRPGFAPSYSEIWLAYGAERGLRLRLAAAVPAEFRAAALALATSLVPGAVVLPIEVASPDTLEQLLRLARACAHPLRVSADVVAMLRRVEARLDFQAVLDQALPAAAADPGLDSLLRLPLLPFQREGVWFAARTGRVLIADEMGLGKTVQAIGALLLWQRHAAVQRTLIVCPTSLKHQWAQELRRFAGIEATVIEGTAAERAHRFAAPGGVKIASYDSLTRDEAVASAWAPQVLVVDEAQRIKNWDTQAARCLKRLETRFAIVLTGTPLENRLEELLSVVQLVDRHRLGPTWRFLHEHQLRDERGRVVGYRQLDRIGSTLAPIMIRRRKHEVLAQLPERSDANVFLPLTPEQRELHSSHADVVARIVQRWRRQGFLRDVDQRMLHAAMSAMRRVCDSTYLLDPQTDSGLKIPELLAWLDERLTDPEHKVVVFSSWLGSHELIVRGLQAAGIGHVFFHGGIEAGRRAALVQRFHEDPDCRVFLATDAGGVGLNLQNAASLIVNLDLPWNPAVLEQRIGRVYRMGQQRRVEVVNFIAENSIEHRILGLLDFKQALSDGALDAGASDIALDGGQLRKFMESVEAVVSADREDCGSTDVEALATATAVPEPRPAGPVGDGTALLREPGAMSEPLSAASASPPEPLAQPSDEPGMLAGPAAAIDADPGAGSMAPDAAGSGQATVDAAAVAQVLAPLLQAASSWLGQFASAMVRTGSPATLARDPASGRPMLQIPLPDPALLRQLADLSEVLGRGRE